MPAHILNFTAAALATKKIFNKSPLVGHHGKFPKSSRPTKTSSLSNSDSSLSLNSGYSSDSDDMDSFLHRHSISLGKSRKDSSSHDVASPKNAKLAMVVESPPLVSYGPGDESSGALFSGQLRLHVLDKTQTFNTIEVRLISSKIIKKPVSKECLPCASTTTELHKWSFAAQPLTLDVGEHKFPVSHLFKGDLPATTHSRLATLDYYFSATAKTSIGETIQFQHNVVLQRAIRPGSERTSVRVFPPTNMTATITLTPVCYANSAIPVKMRLSGISTMSEKTVTRWRLRRLLWRVEEYQKIVSPPCTKHAAKCPEGVKHEETIILGEHEVNFNKNPWKTDLSVGEIDAEFVATLTPHKKSACAVEDPSIKLQVWHHLILEMIVVEEYILRKKISSPTPTGAARILRSQFPLTLTNRAGLGIAWDEETPPVYQDVPPSPPAYPSKATDLAPTTPGLAQVVEVDIAELEERFDDFRLGEPHELARVHGVASASTVTRRRSSSEDGRTRPFRFSADDLLSEPPTYRRREEEVEESVDVQVGEAGR